ncbi:MAG: nicotinate-nucleotide adenylyltransferase [Clostridiales bacterium]|nr:nicotinate-nucleotide adenylyltransferase [Clostridiales bacterium]
MIKIGILGGTFDPIHNGHLKMAEAAMTEYHLDKVIFLTSGNPPHKRGRRITDAKIRHIMVKRAIAELPGFEPCDWEVNRREYSYTVTALEHFKELYPDDELYFIIGGDSLRDFDTWYQPGEILKLCTILVYDRTGGRVQSDFAKQIHGGKIDISSTEIRKRVRKGEDISGFVPDCVKEFIERNGLYKDVPDFEAKLKTMLKPERFVHSLGVRDTAVEMAHLFGANAEKAAIAGLLHDNAKNMSDMLSRCADLEVELDEFERNHPALIHAKLGAETAKCVFGVCDEEIIGAIRWHTLGRVGMTLLEKIIFVADLAEPNRNFPDLEYVRSLAFSDINRAAAECMRRVIEVNTERGVPVHDSSGKVLRWLEEQT